MPVDRRSLAVWLLPVLALLLFALTVLVFYPGYLSWDSAYQWYQARTGQWDNVHPVVMTAIWSLTERAWPGPGGYFLLQIAAYWAGVAVLAIGLFRASRSRVAALVLLGLFPPVFALLPHLWKDIGMLVAGLWAVALLAHDAWRPSRKLRMLALIALVLACMYRHNAVPLVLPFLWYIATRESVLLTTTHRITAAAALLVAITVVSALPNALPGVVQRQVWPITAIWDVAAVSIDENRMLLPAEITDADLSVDELRRDFVAYAAVPVFASGKIRDSVGPTAFDETQERALRAAWLNLWREHPGDYLAHRCRLAALMFGFDRPALPDNLILDYSITPLGDNPAVVPADNAVQAVWQSSMYALRDSPLFAFWLYGAVLAVVALSVRGRQAHPLLRPVLWSALLMVLPLLIAAPGADFRFLVWPVFCAALAIALRLAPIPVAADGSGR